MSVLNKIMTMVLLHQDTLQILPALPNFPVAALLYTLATREAHARSQTQIVDH